MTDIRMLIGGEPRAAATGATFERRNPLDHSVATRGKRPKTFLIGCIRVFITAP